MRPAFAVPLVAGLRIAGLKIAGLGIAGLSVLAGCAPAVTASGDGARPRAERQCFLPSQIQNFRNDRQTFYIRVGRSDVYELSTAGACMDITDTMQLAVLPVRGSSWLCTGERVDLVAPGADRRTAVPCSARIERRMTAEQVAALPDRARP
jgi:hypothetical protein